MARFNLPRTAGSNPGNRPDPALQDKPSDTLNKGWPFARGSKNQLDETTAPWPRPVSGPAQRPE